MDLIAAARQRLEEANGLPAILSAAYDAFEDMLSVIADLQDPGGEAFAAFVMSGASAASGRDAVASAPSLPPVSPASVARPAPAPLATDASARDAVGSLAALSHLLTGRLADAAASAADPGDWTACAQASRHGAEVCSLLGGVPGR